MCLTQGLRSVASPVTHVIYQRQNNEEDRPIYCSHVSEKTNVNKYFQVIGLDLNPELSEEQSDVIEQT